MSLFCPLAATFIPTATWMVSKTHRECQVGQKGMLAHGACGTHGRLSSPSNGRAVPPGTLRTLPTPLPNLHQARTHVLHCVGVRGPPFNVKKGDFWTFVCELCQLLQFGAKLMDPSGKL